MVPQRPRGLRFLTIASAMVLHIPLRTLRLTDQTHQGSRPFAEFRVASNTQVDDFGETCARQCRGSSLLKPRSPKCTLLRNVLAKRRPYIWGTAHKDADDNYPQHD